jgi:hypothetical protein
MNDSRLDPAFLISQIHIHLSDEVSCDTLETASINADTALAQSSWSNLRHEITEWKGLHRSTFGEPLHYGMIEITNPSRPTPAILQYECFVFENLFLTCRWHQREVQNPDEYANPMCSIPNNEASTSRPRMIAGTNPKVLKIRGRIWYRDIISINPSEEPCSCAGDCQIHRTGLVLKYQDVVEGTLWFCMWFPNDALAQAWYHQLKNGIANKTDVA